MASGTRKETMTDESCSARAWVAWLAFSTTGERTVLEEVMSSQRASAAASESGELGEGSDLNQDSQDT